MDRRNFLQVSVAAAGSGLRCLAETPIPRTTLGKTGLVVSRVTLGGYHMAVGGEAEAIRIIHRALDLGVNFFDSAHHYHQGRSDEIYGKALGGAKRREVVLMSKAEMRDAKGALRQLEESLRRMRTDYLDLWQCHQVSEMEEVGRIMDPGGALEAFETARTQGKVLHIGFTGHRDPAVHLRLLDAYDGWETVQHPINLIDPHYLSFIDNVLPTVRARGLGLLGMKSNAMGAITRHGIAGIEECLRFAWSQDIDTLVSGVQTVAELEQNVMACKTFRPMTPEEQRVLLARTAHGRIGSEVENYKRGPARSA